MFLFWLWMLSWVHTTRLHGPCSRAVTMAVNSGVQNGVKMTRVCTGRVGYIGDQHGP